MSLKQRMKYLPLLTALFLLLCFLFSSRSSGGVISKQGRTETEINGSDKTSEKEPVRKECACRKQNGDNLEYNFCFSVSVNGTIKWGQKFDCKWLPLLDKLQILDSSAVVETQFESPIFVTASSSDHFSESRAFIASTRARFGNLTRIVFYDIGLNDMEAAEIKAACDVEYRKFPFDEYPESVRNLMTYRWKILIISELQREYSTFWWADSSVRWLNNTSDDVYRAVSDGRLGSYVIIDVTGHGIMAATNPAMYKYLPINEDEAKTTMMYGATYALFHRSPASIEALKWWFLCAMEDNCINPPESHLHCKFVNRKNYALYANCHRFDQSAINIILAQIYNYNDSFYTTKNFKRFGGVMRGDISDAKLAECVKK